jgi:hypothetical protein
VSAPTPLLDFFKRGEVARDIRLLAARGALAPRAHEQLAILIHLLDDPDRLVRSTAEETLARIPEDLLRAHLGRADVPIDIREFFADRGVFPAEIPAIEIDDPLIDAEPATSDDDADGDQQAEDSSRLSLTQQVAKMSFTERLKAALKGSREMRALLIRDPNKVVSLSVLSSPKVTESEVEAYAKMPTVAEDVLRTIGSHRAWLKNYGITVGLTRNPKTPLALSLNLMNRLNDRDLAMLSIDRNVPEPLRVAARKRVVAASSRR